MFRQLTDQSLRGVVCWELLSVPRLSDCIALCVPAHGQISQFSERGVAILWATHLCDEVADADRVVVLHRGKVLADTTPKTLVTSAGTATIEEAFLAMTGNGGK